MGQNLFKSKRNDEDNNNHAQLTDDENLFFEFIVSPEYLDWRNRNDKTITEEEILFWETIGISPNYMFEEYDIVDEFSLDNKQTEGSIT